MGRRRFRSGLLAVLPPTPDHVRAVMAKQNKLRNGFSLGGIERQTERRRNREVRHAPAGTGALTLTLDPTARLDQGRFSAQMDEGITGPYV
ncbi:hypothetical protein DPX16_4403 [Anabarilius grahami]|uniref:Uncharacterized protein n=1 Tax=Anabarilius grahami TaxID=495550 RepID=A0A3N0Z5L6_ANAGA|nr:hypothetical protein DPX16_4403 [Anabarilius grahami]